MPKGSKVLMADDDKMLVDMYKERLELAGYQVTISRNGEEALATIRETKPDIILLDIMMPKVNGYEALASIKSDPQTKDIPVIMLSALMRDFNREKAVEAGADDYLIKSEAMPADVITKIEQVLAKYGKGAVPAPGMTAPSIPVPSATPPATTSAAPIPTMPVTPPQPTPPPPPPAVKPTPPATPPEKIVFEPAKPTPTPAEIETKPVGAPPPPPLKPQKQIEEVPVVKLEPNAPQPQIPWGVAPPPEKPQRSPASIALIVILAILFTALINDLIIYYLFFMRK